MNNQGQVVIYGIMLFVIAFITMVILTQPIKDFMTSREKVVWLDINDPIEEIRRKITTSDKSVFPICDGSLNKNIGAIETKDVLNHLFDTGFDNMDLKSIIQPVMRINAEVPSLVATERLKKSAISIVLITEKSSDNIIGIISFHDILEEIVGEFQSSL